MAAEEEIKALVSAFQEHKEKQNEENFEFRRWIAVQTEVQRGMLKRQEEQEEKIEKHDAALYGNGKSGVLEDVRNFKKLAKSMVWLVGGGLSSIALTIVLLWSILRAIAEVGQRLVEAQ